MAESIMKIILEASFTAGIAAIAVMLIRIPMKKAPKRWSYVLWAVVFFRCLCPFSVESAVSLFNIVPNQNFPDQNISYDTEIIDPTIYSYREPYDDSVYVDYSGNAAFNKTDSNENPDTENSGNSVDSNTIIFAVWAAGAAAMTLYAVISYVRLKKKLKTAVKTDEGIYETDLISTAFSAGFFPPRIYIPRSLSAKERELIIAHERVHIMRLDFLANPIAFIGLAIHWFNPLIWIAFIFMTRDMELSCDEAVLEALGLEEKTAYSEALLQVSIKRSGLAVFPQAFAETGIKGRVKNVLGYKKPRIISSVIAAAIVIVMCVVLGTNAVGNSENDAENSLAVLFEGENARIIDSSGNSVFFIHGKKPYLYYSFGEDEKTSSENDDIDFSKSVKLGKYDFYKYDKPCLVPVLIFKSGNETRYSWNETALELDFDASKVKRFIVNDARISNIDGQTTIKADVEFQFTGDYQWQSRIKFNEEPEICWYMAGSSPNGGCEIGFEATVPPEPSDKNTYSEFLGYGMLLCGFDDAEIGYNFSKTVVQPAGGNTENVLSYSITDPSVVIEFYENTIKQPEWISEQSREKRGEMLQIPEEILYDLSTEALAEAVLAYPFFMDVYAFDNMQTGLNSMYNSFNGVRELSKRSDAAAALLNIYKNEPVIKSDEETNNLFRICNIELLLSQEYIISKMSSKEISDLSNTVYNKYSEKNSSGYYGTFDTIFYDLAGITVVNNKSDLIALTESTLHYIQSGAITLKTDLEGNLTPESSFEFLFKKYMNEEDYSIEFLSGTEIEIIFNEDLDKYAYYSVLDILDYIERNFYPDYELKFSIGTPSDDTFAVSTPVTDTELS